MVNGSDQFEYQALEVPFDEALAPTVVARALVSHLARFAREPEVRTGVASTATALAASVSGLANERLAGQSQRRVSFTTQGVSTNAGRNARQAISLGDGICCGWVNFFSGEAVLRSYSEVGGRVRASGRPVELLPTEYGLLIDAVEDAMREHRVDVRRDAEPQVYEYAPASSSAAILTLTVAIAALVGALTVWLLARAWS